MDRLDPHKYAPSLASWWPWASPSRNRTGRLDQDAGHHNNSVPGPNSNGNGNPPANHVDHSPVHRPHLFLPFHQEQTSSPLHAPSSCSTSSPSAQEIRWVDDHDHLTEQDSHHAYYLEAAHPTSFDEEGAHSDSNPRDDPDFGPDYLVSPEQNTHYTEEEDEDDDEQQPLDPETEDMARSRASGPPRRPADLKGVLTPAERDELVVLVARILERISRQLSEIFDTPPTTPIATKDPTYGWLALSMPGMKDHQDAEAQPLAQVGQGQITASPTESNSAVNAANPPSTAVGPNGRNSNQRSGRSFSKAHQIIEKEEKEAMTPQLRELKKELLTMYKKWQTIVTNRVRDVRVTESGQPSHGGDGASSPGGRGGGGRWPRGGRGNRGGRGRGGGGLVLNTVTSRPPPIAEIDPQLLRWKATPCSTSLWQLPLEKRKLVLHAMLLLVLSLEEYTAYARLFMLRLTSSLNLSLKVLQEDEMRVAQGLGKAAAEINPDEIVKEKAEENKTSRRIKAGAAGIAGAVLVGVTGGIAAPLVAAGIGTVLGGIGLGATAAAGLLGTVAESGVVVGTLFGIYGARASVKSMESYARDIQDFAFIPLHGKVQAELKDAKDVHPEDRRLRLVMCISGWLTKEEDVIKPWKCIGHQAEVYALRWELNALLNMGNSLETVIKSTAWSIAKKEIISRTIFASLMEGLWPIGLLKINKIIDNPWSMGMVRAEKAGLVLADTIQRKLQGGRPITLVGYSLAARAIYTCLMVLAERRQFGLIDSVVMIGTPAPSETRVWLTLKSVVAGRLINVYSENDYILGFLFRMSNLQFGIAGLQAIKSDEVENYDASNLVSGHLRYQYLIGTILKNVGFEDIDLEQVAKDEEVLREMDEKFDRERCKKPAEGTADRDTDMDVDMDEEAARIEKEVQEKNDWTQVPPRPRRGGGGGGRRRKAGQRSNSRRNNNEGQPKTGMNPAQT